MFNDLYYRILRRQDSDLLTIVAMQSHDEWDYDESRFLCAKGTDSPLLFSTEKDAIKFLNDNIKHEYIEPEFLIRTQQSNDKYYKDE